MPQMDTILIADDDAQDIALLKRSLEQLGVTNPVFTVANGKDALDYLVGRGAFTDRKKFPAAKLVFLDLRMPLMDGFEVLNCIRELKVHVTTVVLAAVREMKDIQDAYDLGAFSFLRKPVARHELDHLLHAPTIADRIEIVFKEK